MGKHVNSQVVSVRLERPLVALIDAEADAQGITRHELLKRRITTSFRHVREFQKTAQERRDSAQSEQLPDLED